MDTPGKKPPCAVDPPFTLLLRRTRIQARISGWNPDIWGEDDYCILDGDRDVGRIYKELVQGAAKWLWCLHTSPAPLPNRGTADTLEECAADFKRRYAQIRDTHGPGRR